MGDGPGLLSVSGAPALDSWAGPPTLSTETKDSRPPLTLRFREAAARKQHNDSCSELRARPSLRQRLQEQEMEPVSQKLGKKNKHASTLRNLNDSHVTSGGHITMRARQRPREPGVRDELGPLQALPWAPADVTWP